MVFTSYPDLERRHITPHWTKSQRNLLCVLYVSLRSLRLSRPFNAENAEIRRKRRESIRERVEGEFQGWVEIPVLLVE
jgi:hypothetical protein